jgi:hypothetical protein
MIVAPLCSAQGIELITNPGEAGLNRIIGYLDNEPIPSPVSDDKRAREGEKPDA